VLAFVFRRVLVAAPAALVLALLLFVALASSPPPAGIEGEALAQRFLGLPLVVNLDPEDRPKIVASAVERLRSEEGEPRARDVERLLRIGAAGLENLVDALEREPLAQRVRLSRELAPLAFRMEVEDARELDVPQKADRFWRRVLDDRGPDLRGAMVRRILRRHLADRREALYARQLRMADTAALVPLFEALDAASPESRAELETLAIAAVRRTGVTVGDAAALRTFWSIHRAEFIEYDALERVVARLTETRFGHWAGLAVTQRFGVSWRDGRPVLDDLVARGPISLRRTLLATLVALAIGLPLGALAAARRRTPSDVATLLGAVLALSLPAFAIAMVARAALPSAVDGGLVLAVVVGVAGAAPLARATRASFLDVAKQPFITTARALGVRPFALYARHLGRVALVPLVAQIAVLVPTVFSAGLVGEAMLGLSGLGRATIDAVFARDLPWLMALTLLVGASVAGLLVLADLIVAALDPRVRRSLAIAHVDD
jgi:ABC-type dipeptide/oligopeptide/nickel transport system permease component